MFGRIGFTEILVILVIGLLLFGPKKLPELGRSFGETIAQYKKAACGKDDGLSNVEKKKEDK